MSSFQFGPVVLYAVARFGNQAAAAVMEVSMSKVIEHVSELVNRSMFHAMKAVQCSDTLRWSVHVQVKPKARFQPLAGTDVRSKRAAVGIIQAFTAAPTEQVIEEAPKPKAKAKTTAKRVTKPKAGKGTGTKPKARKSTPKTPNGSGTGSDPVETLRQSMNALQEQFKLLLETPEA